MERHVRRRLRPGGARRGGQAGDATDAEHASVAEEFDNATPFHLFRAHGDSATLAACSPHLLREVIGWSRQGPETYLSSALSTYCSTVSARSHHKNAFGGFVVGSPARYPAGMIVRGRSPSKRPPLCLPTGSRELVGAGVAILKTLQGVRGLKRYQPNLHLSLSLTRSHGPNTGGNVHGGPGRGGRTNQPGPVPRPYPQKWPPWDRVDYDQERGAARFTDDLSDLDLDEYTEGWEACVHRYLFLTSGYPRR